MLDTPQIVQTSGQLTAVIHLSVPREDMPKVMGPAVGELMATLGAQNIAPAGPLFAYHLRIDPQVFEFEVGVPVDQLVTAEGRVKGSQLPATTVVRTTYQGGYEGLGAAWAEFDNWMKANGLIADGRLWECYVSGPESSSDPAEWRTELNRPLVE